uniref:Lysophosphatidic acid acyltransferase n=1 Tax=Trepomonas sp. PC1 TaxID=1076344 RepID=A0A146KIN0_9EUKA|eukprot:JAP95251.1 Lysophosphatidic acid acyltransferase [Trepomonas sp. PC1]
MINNDQLKSALQDALTYCKLNRYDYTLTQNDLPKLQKQFEKALRKKAQEVQNLNHFELTAQLMGDFANTMIQDSFTECFKSHRRNSWNTTPFLYFLYCIGVVIRYGFLLPLRMLIFFATVVISAVLLILIEVLIPHSKFKKTLQLATFRKAAQGFCLSFFTVIRKHGQIHPHKPGRIYVANHTTTFDFAVLSSITPFSTIGQKHKGFQGFIQKYIVSAIDPVWFERTDKKQRKSVAELLKERTFDESCSCSMVVFPEGCCVNNRFIVQFKKGAFDLGAEVCPVAIRYGDGSLRAYQNSKKQNFIQFLVGLWTQWVMLVDVWFLEPLTLNENETADEFAHRTQLMIAQTAGLVPRQWDGYLKYVQVNDTMKKEVLDANAKKLGLVVEEQGDEVSFSYSGSTQMERKVVQ